MISPPVHAARASLRGWVRTIAVVAAYCLATLVLASPFVDYRHLASTCYNGDVDLVMWTLSWDSHALRHWLPLFDANVFYPAAHALDYNEHLVGLALFFMPFYAASNNAVLAYNIIWLSAWVLNGLAAHLLARRYVRDELAAFAGGLVFAFSFFRAHHFAHLGLAWTFWIPLSLLALERWYRCPTWRRTLAVAVIVTLQALTNWYLAVLVLLADGLFMACLVVFRSGDADNGTSERLAPVGSRTTRRIVHGVVILAVVGGATWPLARHYRGLERPSRSEVASNSADWASYLVPPQHTWPGRVLMSRGWTAPRWLYGERTTFAGLTALGLSIVGVAALVLRGQRRQRPWVPRAGAVFFPLVAIVGLGLSFGPSMPGAVWRPFDVLTALPGAAGMRSPGRFALLVVLGMSVLTAIGAARLHQRFGAWGRLATLGLIPLMLSEWYVVGFSRPVPRPIPAVYRYLATVPARAVVSLPIYRGTPEWYRDLAYLYYSTGHWHPIVNGGGRAEPPDYSWIVGHMRAFAGPNCAKTMRRLGIDYVVLHVDGSPATTGMLQEALSSGTADFDLVGRFDRDYLFKVRQVSTQ